MAMLAEPRRKTKFVLTPKSKPLWTSESNGIQFGKKLMEKMGWNAGEGLGALGQGIQEPLRQAFKQDTKGMGYSGDGNPFENLDQFNALLASLSGEEPVATETPSFESLEEKSKRSKSRVHYKKFTRGKDLANYSNVDLTCIVGTGKKPKEEEQVEEEVIDGTGETENSHGVTTINSGSIADYFKLKMGQKKLGGFVSDEKNLNDAEEFNEERRLKKDKRKCSQEETHEIISEVPIKVEEIDLEGAEEGLNKEERRRKKHKRKRNREETETDGKSSEEAIKVEEVDLECAEEGINKEKKHKKKKRKHHQEETRENDQEICIVEEGNELGGAEENLKKDKKKSKKKKRKSSIKDQGEEEPEVHVAEDNEETNNEMKRCLETVVFDDDVIEIEVHKKKRKKKDKGKDEEVTHLEKKSKKKKHNDELEVIFGDETKLVQENDVDQPVIKKKKKRKSKDKDREDSKELSKDFEEKINEESIDTETVVVKKKKEKKRSKENVQEDTTEETRKKKKKDKKIDKIENNTHTETEPEITEESTSNKKENSTEIIDTNFVGANLNSIPGYGSTRRQHKQSSQ